MADHSGMSDEAWLIRDHSHWWCLPPPLPPARWPRMLLAVVVAELVVAVVWVAI
jgi:hypothetical protein